jgi:hypothetical protein
MDDAPLSVLRFLSGEAPTAKWLFHQENAIFSALETTQPDWRTALNLG